jgi:hypothetical protein
MKNGIFVSIAAYRDAELARTVRELFARANRPQRLTVAVLDQSEKPAALTEKPRGAKILHAHCHPSESRGACWARAQLQRKMGGESYYLQLDSHHVFKHGWDELLLAEFAKCPSPHPVLTSYLPPYELKRGRPRINAAAATPMHFSHFDHDGVVIYRSYSYVKERDEAPLPARFFSGHFAFARRDFAERVPYDPELYFHGEESTLAARAFTNGFDLFHPGGTIAWHHYVRQGQPRHWDPRPDAAACAGPWVALQRQGVHKYRRIFCLLPHVSPVDGLGTQRKLAEYEAWAGLDHYWQVAHPNTANRQPPPAAGALDWTVAEGLLKRTVLRVGLPPLASIDPRPAAQIHLAILDASPRDAAALRCTPEEYAALHKSGWTVTARYRSAPLRLVVWPLIGREWGNRHESPLEFTQPLNGQPADPVTARTPPHPALADPPRPRRKRAV